MQDGVLMIKSMARNRAEQMRTVVQCGTDPGVRRKLWLGINRTVGVFCLDRKGNASSRAGSERGEMCRRRSIQQIQSGATDQVEQ